MTETSPAVKQRLALPVLGAWVVPPWLLMVTAIISVQIGAALAKQLFDVASPAGVVFLRTLLGSMIFLIVGRPRLRAYGWRDYRLMAIYGASIAGMMLSFYAAINLIPLGITVAIAFSGPLIVAVLGSRRGVDLIWVGLAALGVLLLSPFTNAELDPLGVGLAFLSAGTWVAYIFISKRVNRRIDLQTALSVSMFAAAVVAAPVGLAGALEIVPNIALIGLALLVALLSSAIPFSLELVALRQLTPRAFGLLVSLEPGIAALIGFVALGEALGLREIAGIAFVCIAAAATARGSSHA